MSEDRVPRRARMEDWCPAEKAIYTASLAVEGMPADVRLTDAVVLLGQAKDRVADFVDGIAPMARSVRTPLVYLASPYSDPSVDVMRARFAAARRATAQMMGKGLHVFSPIVHNHPLATMHDLPVEWPYWSAFDLAMLERCDRLAVLRLSGWEDSVGVAAEIEFMTVLGRPVEYVDPK